MVPNRIVTKIQVPPLRILFHHGADLRWSDNPPATRSNGEFVMRLSRLAIAALAACALWTAAIDARADTNIGSLVCNVSSGFGYLIGSNRNVSCVFNRSNGTVERYNGQIRDWGFDLGYYHAGSIVWGVIAPGDNVAPGSLAGDYTGGGAGGSAGVGVKVNLLFGGDGGKISLQPLQFEGNVGIGANVGVTRLSLTYGQ